MKLVYFGIAILIFLLGIVIGIGIGEKMTIDYGIKVMNRLIELNKVNITIDPNMIAMGVYQYKNNIGGCLFVENASVYNNAWN